MDCPEPLAPALLSEPLTLNKGPRAMLDESDLPIFGNIDCDGGHYPPAQQLYGWLTRATNAAWQFSADHPRVAGTHSLPRRIIRDRNFVERFLLGRAGPPPCADPMAVAAAAAGTDGSQLSTTPPPREAASAICSDDFQIEAVTLMGSSDAAGALPAAAAAVPTPPTIVDAALSGPPLYLGPSQTQGIVNNLRGYHGELLAARLAPDVVALSRCFRYAAPAGQHGSVEVDVVAQGGSVWIEAKDQQRCAAGSPPCLVVPVLLACCCDVRLPRLPAPAPRLHHSGNRAAIN